MPTRRTLRADLLRLVFEVDAFFCPRCDGRMRVLAAITEAVDEQHRPSVGAVHQYTEALSIGFRFQWLHLGEGKTRQNSVRGDYERNDVFFLGATINWGTKSWKDTLGLGDS